MNDARFGHAAVVISNVIYVAAGRGDAAVLGSIDRIAPDRSRVDLLPAAFAPRTLAEMPVPRSRVALVHRDGKLYAIGGADSEDRRTGRVDIYDIARDTRTRGADMPTPRRSVPSATRIDD